VSLRRTWSEGWWSRARRSPSTNSGPRPAGTVIDLVVLHSISLPPGQFGGSEVEDFFRNRLDTTAHPYFAQLRDTKVSAHFFVRRTGEVVQFVSCDERAWHAGASEWQGRTQCNDFSIGIELEGLDDGTVFTSAQYSALARLLRALAHAYAVREVVGHEHIAPGRKVDPGAGFDWPRLRRELPRGLGMPALQLAGRSS
jgi:N-acetyl-anhydromuramoyl-L-alanine amidase